MKQLGCTSNFSSLKCQFQRNLATKSGDFEGVATTAVMRWLDLPPLKLRRNPRWWRFQPRPKKKGGFCEKKMSFFIGFTGKNDNLGENLGFSLQFQELVVFLPQIGRATWTNRYEEHVDLEIFSKIRVEHG